MRGAIYWDCSQRISGSLFGSISRKIILDITRILERMSHGDERATAELVPIVYEELRRLAARQLGDERAEHTLTPTALVHEAYLRLVPADERQIEWNSRGHFFGAAAEAMRRVLVDHARSRQAAKRGGGVGQVPLDRVEVPAKERRHDLVALDEALTQLQTEQPSLAELVKLRYFAGLTMPQVAETLGISLRTAERQWTYARAWLYQAVLEGEGR